jgi:hypothetical protein
VEDKVLKTFNGPSGEIVEIWDRSVHYAYKNIYLVRLGVKGTFPNSDALFMKTLEKMGVFDNELEKARQELIANFEKTVLPYLGREDFLEKLEEKKRNEKPKASGYGK